jgi:hypothetical protein
MKYKQSDFVVYKTKNSGQVATWVKGVFERQNYYTLDFNDTEATEEELSDYDASNFTVPDAQGDTNIDEYHRDTIIDRIVTFLQTKKRSEDLKVSKYAGTIIVENIIKNPAKFEKENFDQEVTRYNDEIAKLQTRFPDRWKVEILVELHTPLKHISLNPIKI